MSGVAREHRYITSQAFVLAGGKSSRMGWDKAFLPLDGTIARAPTSRLCVIPQNSLGRLYPLCSLYHRDVLPMLKQSIQNKCFKMHDLVAILQAAPWAANSVETLEILRNANMPEDWNR